MACCLTAPSHYLNQCWLFLIVVLWHSFVSNFTANVKATVLFCIMTWVSLKIIILKLLPYQPGGNELTHWGWVTHICVNNFTIIDSDNGLSPGRRKAIIQTVDGILSTGTLGTNFNKFSIEIHIFSFKKCLWKCRLENGGHFVSNSMCYSNSHIEFSWLCKFVSGMSLVTTLLCDQWCPVPYSNSIHILYHRWKNVVSMYEIEKPKSTNTPLLTLRGMSGGPYHATTQYYFYPMSKIQNLINIYPWFWMWYHHGIALWHHGNVAWHDVLFLTTASNVNSWADVANHFIQMLNWINRALTVFISGHIWTWSQGGGLQQLWGTNRGVAIWAAHRARTSGGALQSGHDEEHPWWACIDTLRLERSGRHFANATSTCILLRKLSQWNFIEICFLGFESQEVSSCIGNGLGLNTLRPRQNGRYFADDIFKCIFLNKNVWIPTKISLTYICSWGSN